MSQYIIQRGGTYHYRRRIPKSLQPYFELTEYTKALARTMTESKAKASVISAQFAKALLALSIGQDPDVSELTTVTMVIPVKPTNMRMSELAEEYLSSLNITPSRLKVYRRILDNAITIMGNKINMSSLDRFKATLAKMPKRNIEIYKKMPVREMIKRTFPDKDLVSLKNCNEYIVVVNSMLIFGAERGYIDKPYRIKKYKITVAAREERRALDKDRIQWLIEGAHRPVFVSAYQILYLSGMRLSELYKCKVSTVDGVKCFDLTATDVSLKTDSSHRLIPIHSSIVDPEKMLEDIRTVNLKYYSNVTNKRLEKGESLYSLRHSFATHLIANEVKAEVVSELMGHAHKSMTMSRYAKGFPIKLLQEAVESLSL